MPADYVKYSPRRKLTNHPNRRTLYVTDTSQIDCDAVPEDKAFYLSKRQFLTFYVAHKLNDLILVTLYDESVVIAEKGLSKKYV